MMLPVLIAHGAGGIGKIPLPFQDGTFIAAHEFFPDPFPVDMIDPQGIFIRNGDHVQVGGGVHHVVQIIHQRFFTAALLQRQADRIAFRQGDHRGLEDLIDFGLQGADGIPQCQTQGNTQQDQPAQGDPAHDLDKIRDRASFLFE